MLPLMLLPPPLDKSVFYHLSFLKFTRIPLPPYAIPCHPGILFVALCISLSPSCSYTIHCGVYLPFFTYIMEDLAADLNCLFLFTFVHAVSPQYNMLAFLCESLGSKKQSKIDKVELYEPLDCDSFSISSCDNPSRRLSR